MKTKQIKELTDEYGEWLYENRLNYPEFERVLGIMIKEIERELREEAYQKLSTCANRLFKT